MKKQNILFFLYYIILLLIIIFYITNKNIRSNFFNTELYRYLGVMLIPFVIFLLLFGFVFLIKDDMKKFSYEFKLYIFMMLSYSTYFSYIFIVEKNFFLDTFDKTSLFHLILDVYKFGYIACYIISKIIDLNIKYNHILLSLYSIDIIFLIFLIYSPIKLYIKNKYSYYKEQKELLLQEKLVREQIKIKEIAERKESEKLRECEKFKDKHRDKKVRKNLKGQKLVNIININEDK